MKKDLPTPVQQQPPAHADRRLTAAEFQGLADVPPELEWFANIDNPRTRKAYQSDLEDFSRFVGISQPEEFRQVTRAHVLAWRKDLESRSLAPATIRRKLAALTSLFDYLCEQNAITHNPVNGVKRPKEGSNEGKTPALSDDQARLLLVSSSSSVRRHRGHYCCSHPTAPLSLVPHSDRYRHWPLVPDSGE